MHFISLAKYLPKYFIEKILSFFREPVFKKKYEYSNYYLSNYELDQKGKLYNDYFYLRGIPVDSSGKVLIKNTREILNDLWYLDNIRKNVPTLERFSVKNIDKKTLADYDTRFKYLILKEFNPKKNVHKELLQDPYFLIDKEKERCSEYNDKSGKCQRKKCFFDFKTKKCIPHKDQIEKFKQAKLNKKKVLNEKIKELKNKEEEKSVRNMMKIQVNVGKEIVFTDIKLKNVFQKNNFFYF